ncbi:MAG: NADH-quinone oxidoreductase subunit I [Actinobacteria bacterium]|nr:NADH-quinone oxidoreductase subunit I [Actinomycetota bacterium]
MRALEQRIAGVKGLGAVYGLAKGLSVTMKTMTKRAVTQQYPHVKPDLPPRTRGIIALKEENCTICMLCSRECPDWCIYIDSHKAQMPPKTPGARPRTRNVLDRFAIDFALCMYCGICVEVCPFDALFWSPHFEYSTDSIVELTHEMDTLGEWMALVPAPPPLDAGAEPPAEEAAEAKVYTAMATAPAAAPAESPAPPAAAPSETGPAPDSATDAGGPTLQSEGVPKSVAPSVRHDEPPPQIDQETYDKAISEGKSDREARALAKKAWVIKRRKTQGGGRRRSSSRYSERLPRSQPSPSSSFGTSCAQHCS